MTLKDQIATDMRDAMRSGDERRKLALRMAMASIKNAEIAGRKDLDDNAVLQVLQREVKQRRESIEEFRKGNRQDLIDKEQAEIEVLQPYLPTQMSREAITVAVREVIAETGATGPGDKNKVMPVLMKRLAGKAEGRTINEVVTELLTAR